MEAVSDEARWSAPDLLAALADVAHPHRDRGEPGVVRGLEARRAVEVHWSTSRTS